MSESSRWGILYASPILPSQHDYEREMINWTLKIVSKRAIMPNQLIMICMHNTQNFDVETSNIILCNGIANLEQNVYSQTILRKMISV
jgi:hypothetical protein